MVDAHQVKALYQEACRVKMEDEVVELVDNPSTRKTSNVWEHFGFWKKRGADGKCFIDKTKAVCKLCKFQCNYMSNTTNLTNHLRNKHPTSVPFLHPRPSEPLLGRLADAANASVAGYVDVSPEPSYVAQAVGEFLIANMLPPSIVQSKSFRHLLGMCGPDSFTSDESHYTGVLFPKMYQHRAESVRAELADVLDVSLAVDLWLAVTGDCYCTVTCHGLSSDWLATTFVLSTRRLTGDRLDGKARELLQFVTTEWCLANVGTVTVDGSPHGADVAKAVGALGWQHVSCLGYRICAAVRAALALPDVSNLLAKAREIMASGSRSVSEDTPSQWDSTLEMLSAFLDQSSAMPPVSLDLDIKQKSQNSLSGQLSDNEQEVAEAFVLLVKPMKEALNLLYQDNRPTLSMALPTLVKLRRLLRESSADSELVGQMKRAMSCVLDSDKYQRDCSFINLACLVDPRFKSLLFVTENVRRATHDQAIHMMADCDSIRRPSLATEPAPLVVKEEPGVDMMTSHISNLDTPDSSSASCDFSPPRPKRPKSSSTESSSLGDWLGDVINPSDNVTESSAVSRATLELNRYLSESPIPPDEDPLLWWRSRQSAYPTVAQVARRVLAIPACSAPAERVFSTSDSLVSPQYSRMDLSSIDMALFLHKNCPKGPWMLEF